MNERVKVVDEISGTPNVVVRTDDEYTVMVEIRAYDCVVRIALRPTWTNDNKIYISVEGKEDEQ